MPEPVDTSQSTDRAPRKLAALVETWLILDFFGDARRTGEPSSSLTSTIFTQSFLALVFAALTHLSGQQDLLGLVSLLQHADGFVLRLYLDLPLTRHAVQLFLRRGVLRHVAQYVVGIDVPELLCNKRSR
jgi:hypothetical protein